MAAKELFTPPTETWIRSPEEGRGQGGNKAIRKQSCKSDGSDAKTGHDAINLDTMSMSPSPIGYPEEIRTMSRSGNQSESHGGSAMIPHENQRSWWGPAMMRSNVHEYLRETNMTPPGPRKWMI
jgi:hypothetical protein